MSTDPGFLRSHHGRYNVIQIMCDQLPYYALGCYGHPLVQTPNLDALAARGVLCTQAFSQSPVCCPSRASQLSALYPANHGIMSNTHNLEVMNPQVRFLSDRFYEEEYVTAHFGKWHCLRSHTDCQFTEFKFLEESVPIWPQHDIARLYPHTGDPVCLHYKGLVHAATHPCAAENTGPARITDDSLDFLERFAYAPLFLRVSYLGPHAPVLVPRPYDTMYDPDAIELPDYPYEEFANRPSVIRALQARCIEGRAQDLDGMTPAQAIRTHVAYNLGLISHIDDQIGRLLDKVRELGLEQQTVVLFTTDHGGFWGEHGLLEKSGYALYRNLLQLPLIVSCPGLLPEGHRYDGLIEAVDIYPTLLDLADVAPDRRVNGRSFREALLTGEDPGRDDVFAEFQANGRYAAALRDPRWTFIWHAPTGEAELYDRQADPDERFNLADEARYTQEVNTLSQRLLSRMMDNRDVELLPDVRTIHRSPIYLTPGHNAQGHEQALIRRARGEPADEFPTTPSPSPEGR